ncbi:hypothetical protein HY312_02130 [Candidatus Saccharibacteria bacterium]|nr:hypothetical protein [Candidatus Saccharibacteria bacterium]
MTKSTITIDIDDVLADQAEAFISYSNKTWGTNLSIDDYTEHWVDLWKVDLIEIEARAHQYHESGTMGTFTHKSEALPVLKKLKESYRLVIVTSRRTRVKDETLDWIDKNFAGIFDEVHFAGFFDSATKDRWKLTKADIVKELGAEYLIDDQLKHCFATASVGIETVLFGDYTWNRVQDALPASVTRCKTWEEVGAYFESKK